MSDTAYKIAAELGHALHKAQLDATRRQHALQIPEIRNCARCSGVHTDMTAMRFQQFEGNGSHYMYCPTTGEPIIVEIQIGEPDDLPRSTPEQPAT